MIKNSVFRNIKSSIREMLGKNIATRDPKKAPREEIVNIRNRLKFLTDFFIVNAAKVIIPETVKFINSI